KDRLHALAEDGEKREDEESPPDDGAAAAEPLDAPVDLAPQLARVALHPEQHRADHHSGSQVEKSLEQLLADLEALEQNGARDAPDAGVEGAAKPLPASAIQRGEDEGDEQRGFDPLAQGDDQSLKQSGHAA